MMNKADLSKYLRNPENLDEQTISEVNLLKDKFPYFQTAYLLATKNHHNISSPDFERILHLSAAYVSDRRVLYDLLYNLKPDDILMADQQPADVRVEDKKPAGAEIEDQQPPDVQTEDRKPDDFQTGEDRPLTSTGRIIRDNLKDNISETLTSQLQKLDKSDFDKMELIPEVAIDVRKEYGEGIVLDDLDLRIKPSSAEDVKQEEAEKDEIITVDKEVSEKPAEKEPEILELEDQDMKAHGAGIEDVPVESQVISDNRPGHVIQSEAGGEDTIEFDLEDDAVKDSEQHTFTDWLKALDDQAGPAVAATGKSPDGSGKKVPNTDLIDNFISKGSGKIIPVDTGEASAVDISEDSVKEHDGFITDTLAKIYIKQGYYSKAIFAYEKLILKFPEKSSYFAAQIEEIKRIVRGKL